MHRATEGGFLKRLVLVALAAACAFVVSAEPAKAADEGKKPFYYPSELLLGGGITDPFQGIERSGSVNGEIRFQPVGRSDWFFLFRPRPHFGASGNLEGKTSFAYAGATFDIYRWRRLYFNIDFGLAIHDGRLKRDPAAKEQRRLLGTRWEFHTMPELGFQLSRHLAISTWIDHISNAGIGGKDNAGMETTGVRLSYRF